MSTWQACGRTAARCAACAAARSGTPSHPRPRSLWPPPRRWRRRTDGRGRQPKRTPRRYATFRDYAERTGRRSRQSPMTGQPAATLGAVRASADIVRRAAESRGRPCRRRAARSRPKSKSPADRAHARCRRRSAADSTSTPEPQAAIDAEPARDIESVAARARPADTRRRGAGSGRCRGCNPASWRCRSLDAILIGWRSDFVRALPQTASFYALLGLPVNLRGLDFDGITTTTEQHEGVPILVVEGNIVNATRKVVDVPRSQVHRAQCRAAGNLFLDRRAARAVAAAGRGGRLPHPARIAAARSRTT